MCNLCNLSSLSCVNIKPVWTVCTPSLSHYNNVYCHTAYQTPHVWPDREYGPTCEETRKMTASMPVIAYWDCRGLAQPIRKKFQIIAHDILVLSKKNARKNRFGDCLRISLSGCYWSMAVRDTRTERWICQSRIGWVTRPRLDSTFLIFHIMRSTKFQKRKYKQPSIVSSPLLKRKWGRNQSLEQLLARKSFIT